MLQSQHQPHALVQPSMAKVTAPARGTCSYVSPGFPALSTSWPGVHPGTARWPGGHTDLPGSSIPVTFRVP